MNNNYILDITVKNYYYILNQIGVLDMDLNKFIIDSKFVVTLKDIKNLQIDDDFFFHTNGALAIHIF